MRCCIRAKSLGRRERFISSSFNASPITFFFELSSRGVVARDVALAVVVIVG